MSVESADRVEPLNLPRCRLLMVLDSLLPATEIVLTVNETRGVFGAANEAY